ncbi:FAD-dependent oxidoreductase [Terrarubrum flagellatum]|uniref:NAD(P)/FAD-dependent oxidoreductase n=1 Tax=Terrirubrum flagellatum TaxID=2895980 RepID=UPI0031456728
MVVGAGVSGAFVAEALSDAGFEVMIVDRRDGPLRGSTPASTALLQYEIDTPLSVLSLQIGVTDATRAWRRSRLSVESIAARTRELAIECDLERRDALYLAGSELDAKGLRRECDARRLAGFETRYLGRKALLRRFGISREAALLGYDNLAADPRRLAAGYLRAAIARGAKLHTPCDIMNVEARPRGVTATTADGHEIRCRTLVFATGYELPKQVPARGHRIVSTFALATRPQKRLVWPERCFIWEASEPYLYLRATKEGRVICGGEDEEFSDEEKRDVLLPRKIDALRRKLTRLLPDLDTEPDFAWCGSFGASGTGLPSIGEIPGMANCWAVLGYGGNGITHSRIAAEIIRAGLIGATDPDADLFAFEKE